MSYFNHFEIKQLNNREGEYELVIFLDDFTTEFGNEFGVKTEGKDNLLESAKKLMATHYPGLKVTMVRVMVSGLIFTTFPIASTFASAQTSNSDEETVQSSIDGINHYKVQTGDTLWNISQKFHITVDQLKQANNLRSDILYLNQKLIIPKAFHTVVSGDTLFTLSRVYETTIEAIREANQLSSETIQLGQVLVIPQIIPNSSVVPPPESTNSKPETESTYIVISGDSLSLIAKRYGITVEKLKQANHLTSDIIRIGQELLIPTSSAAVQNTAYTVRAGDTLSGIAKQHNLSVPFLKINNRLSNETVHVGQTLRLTEDYVKGKRNEIGTVRMLSSVKLFEKSQNGTLIYKKLLSKGTYTAYSIDYDNGAYNVGGNQWVKIAPDVQFTRVGETPKTFVASSSSDYLTHTVISGDTIWDLSVKYGIPQSELLKANNLKLNSPISIGQKLIVPQHQIAVQKVVSSRHGEHLDWWTEAQYVVPIGKTFKVKDFATGKSFMVKRTIGANHADCETVTVRDSNMAKSIWNGYSWKERPVIIEVDGRKIAASMSFMPHDVEFINNNGIRGHFDIHFKNSTRHKDGKVDSDHQRQINIAAGVSSK
jgi:peptidoglycan DL-endopeptidase LytF